MSTTSKKTREEISLEEAARDPVFLFQFMEDDDPDYGDPDDSMAGIWRTNGVFATREEATAWGEAHAREYARWRVYCVNAREELAEILRRTEDAR